jgi:hypothetical protein
MVYANQYKIINHTSEMIENKINKERVERLGPASRLRARQLSRKYFQFEQMEEAIKNVRLANQQIIYATSIASIGIDIDNLDSILFFGLPSNVSEFIQTLNRTGRKSGRPAFCLCVLGPHRPRDVSYYTFWNLFVERTDLILEPIPLNRFARNAVDKTFNNIAGALMLMHYGFLLGENFIKPNTLKRAFIHQDVDKDQALAKLLTIYRTSLDPSHKYTGIVESLWQDGFVRTIEQRPHNEGDFLSHAFEGRWLMGLRDIKNEVLLSPGAVVERLKAHLRPQTGIATREADASDVAEADDDSKDLLAKDG